MTPAANQPQQSSGGSTRLAVQTPPPIFLPGKAAGAPAVEVESFVMDVLANPEVQCGSKTH